MNITQRVEGDVTVFSMEGRIDTQAATDMDQALLSAVSAGNHNMVVDMSGVDYISSAGQEQGRGWRHEARFPERKSDPHFQNHRV